VNYSIIIALEKYKDSKINPVGFAENDAREFLVAIKNIDFADGDSYLLINSNATKTTIESRIRVLSKTLTPKDKLIFYYAGHGFSSSDKNFITCYDSILDDLEATSISIQHIFSIFKNKCQKIFYFLDSCHSGLNIDKDMRGIYSDLNKSEFTELLKDKTFCLGFAACKSDEFSYPIASLKHGVWTYHLIEALNGFALDALEKDTILTAVSLQNYLSRAVPISLKKAYTRPKAQSPWLFGGFESDVIIGDLSSVIKSRKTPSPSITDIELIMKKIGQIKTLSGFQKSHSVPKYRNHSTEKFLRNISESELEENSKRIQDIVRSELNYKRKDISYSQDDGCLSIFTPDFVANVEISQSDENFGEYIETIRITEISNKDILNSEDFNRAFFNWFDTMVIKLDKSIDIEKLIDDIEDLDCAEISLDYPPSCEYCDISSEGIGGTLRVYCDEITVELSKPEEPKKLVSCLFSINTKLKELKCETKLLK